MNFDIKTIPIFDKQIKKLVQKHPSFKQDFENFIVILKRDPFQGNLIGNNCYKIRIAISSKGKGKSGGTRLITNLLIQDELIYLLNI